MNPDLTTFIARRKNGEPEQHKGYVLDHIDVAAGDVYLLAVNEDGTPKGEGVTLSLSEYDRIDNEYTL